MKLCISLILINYLNVSVSAFNLENRNPIVKKGDPGTYFGYSVAQHKDSHNRSWILVGAPLGKNEQPKTKNSGALFKCPLTTAKQDCVQVQTDGRRPLSSDDFYNDGTEDNTDKKLQPPGPDEIKDGQWLGVTVKSQRPGGNVMVCAHRYIKSSNLSETHHGLGLCHLLDGDLDWQEALEPCDGKPMEHEHLDYAYCQAGTSLALLNDGTALMGAPGPHTWRGAIFAKMTFGDFLTRDKQSYSSPLNNMMEPIDKYSYLGMSVTGGHFFDNVNTTYVSGAPRANLTGQVYFVEKHLRKTEMSLPLILKGEQFASNYGYELLATDVNADGYDDLIVAAPFFFNSSLSQGGAIYVYMNLRKCRNNNQNYTCPPDQILYGKKEESRFGFAMTSLGDINKDGYNDVAIGAPYEIITNSSSGAIYIYLGSKDGLIETHSQKITIPNYTTVGYSLSGGIDMDENNYPDLLVGAYDDDVVMLFKTRPIIHIEIDVSGDLKNIDINKIGCNADPRSPHACFSFKICLRFTRPANYRDEIVVKSVLTGDLAKMRGQFLRIKFKSDTDSSTLVQRFTLYNTAETITKCHSQTVYIKDGIRDILSPIEFSAEYSLDNTKFDSPILNQTSIKKFQATFQKDCGSNEICESILKISAGLPMQPKDPIRNIYELDLGSVDELNVMVNVSNEGESAYEAQLFIIHPKVLNYIALNEKLSDIKCIYYNDTLVTCNLGNPFGTNKAVSLGLRFENNNQKYDREFEFKAFVNTTSNTTVKEISSTFTVAVNMTANVKIDGYGTAYTQFGGTVKGESAIRYFDEIGSRVMHVYQITNEGKWPVENMEVKINWPIQIASQEVQGKWLLYLEDLPVVEIDNTKKEYCTIQGFIANELNYTNRAGHEIAPENLMITIPPPFGMRLRRDLENQNEDDNIVPARLMLGPGETIKNNFTFDCDTNTAKCAEITCLLPTIPRNQGATIRIISRLWNSTLIEHFKDKSTVTIYSRARIVSTNHLTEIDYRQSSSMAWTTAYSTMTGPETAIPLWIILLGCLGGVLLFAIAVCLLWRCGFFRRNKLSKNRATQHKPEDQGLLSSSS